MDDAESETVRIDAAKVAMKKEDVAIRRVRMVGFVIDLNHILLLLSFSCGCKCVWLWLLFVVCVSEEV